MDINRVILSRKGFDSGSGGYPNVIMPDGRLISFPIPDTHTNISYCDLYIEKSLTYADLMKQLNMKDVYNSQLHLDPDINYNCKVRKPDWNAMFGQTGSSQTHLQNHGVAVNDLFLFFGWFKQIEKTDKGYKYVNGTDKHIIFGYLQIGEIKTIDTNNNIYPDWMLDHPHFYRKSINQNNTAYISKDKLSFNNKRLGYGIFNYSDSLVLTNANSNKSIWKLPNFFHPSFNTVMTYHTNEKLWSLHNDYCLLNSVARGQEFVVKNNQNVIEWAKQLILNCKLG